MARLTDATPLIAVEAIAFDSETTGLDTKSARIVQFGAIGLSAGRQAAGDTFNMLVDPGMAIPPASTAIHHIDNDAVKGAPRFAEAWRGFEAYRRKRLVVGYSLGFDFAILENEAERAGLDWQQPRSLCVRLLSVLANPRLPDYSLDAIALWLGVPTEDRHDALGDARIAAAVFIALVPKLAERGIRTLAEAETACGQLDQVLNEHARSGWSEPFTRKASGGRYSSLRVGDPFAFRHRVRDAMTATPVIARMDATASEAIAVMAERQISSLFLHPDAAAGAPVGDYAILTERDVLRALASRGAAVLAGPAADIASKPLIAVPVDDFVFRAISTMRRRRIRHLAAVDGEGRLAGVVSSRDFLKLRVSAAADMHFWIETAAEPAALAEAWSKLAGVASSLLEQELDARHITEIISGELCAITARAGELAEQAMEAAGRGAPPCAYAVLVLGSAGRGESLLAADQDNAIIFETGEPEGETDRWFAEFGERLSQILHAAGVPLCQGGVMARNAAWRGSVETWRERVSSWVSRARPQDLLNVDIFFDLRFVSGDARLATGLRDFAYETGSASPNFAKLMGEGVRSVPPATGLLGGFRTEAGRLDLKLHGLFPIVASSRAMAIRHDIRLHSTAERLDALAARDNMPSNDLAAIREAHGLLMSLLLEQQTIDISAGVPVSNRIEVARLDRRAQARLKRALAAVQRIPDFIRDALFH